MIHRCVVQSFQHPAPVFFFQTQFPLFIVEIHLIRLRLLLHKKTTGIVTTNSFASSKAQWLQRKRIKRVRINENVRACLLSRVSASWWVIRKKCVNIDAPMSGKSRRKRFPDGTAYTRTSRLRTLQNSATYFHTWTSISYEQFYTLLLCRGVVCRFTVNFFRAKEKHFSSINKIF